MEGKTLLHRSTFRKLVLREHGAAKSRLMSDE